MIDFRFLGRLILARVLLFVVLFAGIGATLYFYLSEGP